LTRLFVPRRALKGHPVRTRKTIADDTNFTNRRQAPRAIGAALAGGSVGAAVGCSAEAMPTSPPTASTSGGTGSTSCVEAASETRGPYPDVTGMIGNQAFYRQDIREGRPGVALTLTLTIANVRNGCAPVSGAAVEIWQCDADGHYSEYAQPGYNGTGQTFLRGLQTTNASDNVFSDGTSTEMAALSGSIAAGYTASLTIGVSA
jgi:hypothetical protein